ncbi:MAG TPA: hypothetical protein VGN21_16545, partial [Stellaceae bacterium]
AVRSRAEIHHRPIRSHSLIFVDRTWPKVCGARGRGTLMAINFNDRMVRSTRVDFASEAEAVAFATAFDGKIVAY